MNRIYAPSSWNSPALDHESTIRSTHALGVRVEDVSWGPKKSGPLLLHSLSFSVSAGRILGIVGANGAGKSTLLRIIYRFHAPRTGKVTIDGKDIWQLSPKLCAQNIAVVLQEQSSDFALTVRDIVTLGRTPHRNGFFANGQKDHEVVDKALTRLDLHNVSDRLMGTLSGGERQRVMVARALAQEPKVLVLDEPTNHLDIRHQLEILALIKDLDLTIVTSLHDLNIAARYCDDILILQDGHMVGFGSPDTVLNETDVSNAFNVRARIEQLAPSNTSHLTFHLPH